MEEWQKSRSFPESFRHAVRGIGIAVKRDANVRKHLLFGFAAISLGVFLDISGTHFAILVLLIATIIAMEMVNTVIEYISDILHPEYHVAIKRLKDITAGAVLIMSLAALVIGIVVFWQPLLSLLA